MPVEGSVAIHRCVYNGRVCCERAARVLGSDAGSVTTARWPGAGMRNLASYFESLRTGDKALRDELLQAHVRGDWELTDSVWQRTGVVEQVESDRWFSVARMHGADGALLCWYVNFERPPLWRGDGWETHDLALDLLVAPDLSYRWKDEDEYEHSRTLGIITDAEHKAVQSARTQAIGLVEAHAGPFAAGAGECWLPDPAWPLPTLP
jgi:predicted RNA-binding protein associated with RNAse of E/G family